MQENIAAIMWPSIEMAISEPQEIQDEIHCLTAEVNEWAQVGSVFLSVCLFLLYKMDQGIADHYS